MQGDEEEVIYVDEDGNELHGEGLWGGAIYARGLYGSAILARGFYGGNGTPPPDDNVVENIEDDSDSDGKSEKVIKSKVASTPLGVPTKSSSPTSSSSAQTASVHLLQPGEGKKITPPKETVPYPSGSFPPPGGAPPPPPPGGPGRRWWDPRRLIPAGFHMPDPVFLKRLLYIGMAILTAIVSAFAGRKYYNYRYE